MGQFRPFLGNTGDRETLEAQQFEPVRVGLARQRFFRHLANPFGTAAAHEHTVVQEELQQAQVGIAQMASQEEVRAQPRVQVARRK